MLFDDVNSTQMAYRNISASLTGTTSDPVRDLWISMLIRVDSSTTINGTETVMFEVLRQNDALGSLYTDTVQLGIRPFTVNGVTVPRFVAQTQAATPAVFPDFVPEPGQDYFIIGWFFTGSVSGGLTWTRPRIWVYKDGDPFTLIASNPPAEGSGSTPTYANSLPQGASRVRYYTQNLGAGDVFAVDGIRIARTPGELLGDDTPLRVDLVSFSAKSDGAGSPVTIEWETAAEVDNAGFNLYRNNGGQPGAKLNPFPIPAQGGEEAGSAYSFVDSSPLKAGEVRSYFLEDVELNGTTTLHGPVSTAAFDAVESRVESWSLYN
jgi:hypothetical protein